jgi:hypothetical protein
MAADYLTNFDYKTTFINKWSDSFQSNVSGHSVPLASAVRTIPSASSSLGLRRGSHLHHVARNDIVRDHELRANSTIRPTMEGTNVSDLE